MHIFTSGKSYKKRGGDTGEQPQPGWESTFLNPQLFVAPQSPLFTPYLILILWKYFHNINLKYSSEGSTSQTMQKREYIIFPPPQSHPIRLRIFMQYFSFKSMQPIWGMKNHSFHDRLAA